MSVSIENPPLPLQAVIPSYPYLQYSDDINIVAWFQACNAIAQGYLDWFNGTPLALYTSPNISGPLLDWIGQGIYGISRPVFSDEVTKESTAAVNESELNAMGVNSSSSSTSGSATIANDDYYKRVLTWMTFIGMYGPQVSLMSLRLRIARFLYGVNGSDVPISDAYNVNIAVGSAGNDITITIPAGQSSTYFQEAVNTGVLTFPFMIVPTVTIS